MNAGGVDKACKSNDQHHFRCNNQVITLRIIKKYFLSSYIQIVSKVVLVVANEVVTRGYTPGSQE